MIKPITFCIPTAKNEKEYVRLLLESLINNTQIHLHEVLVFIDTDNQGSYDMLMKFKDLIPNLRIYKNNKSYQIGGQRNISIMFNNAKNDIVCYLQSDMVVGKDIDKHISKNMEFEDVVLACTRIEPPLHPESPEKLVRDFGLSPEDFNKIAFNDCVENLQKENRPLTEGHFAPFAIYKKVWIEKLGGFDTQFRCSREDSDMIIRMNMHNLKLVQSWDACVYHFTCVSSRGKDWYKTDNEAKYKNEIQHLADLQELKRFIRKWGFFGHNPKNIYNITINIEIDRFVNMDFLKFIEPYFKKINLSDAAVAKQLARQLYFESHYYTNLRWDYPTEYWYTVQHLFNPTDFKKRIISQKDITDDIVVFCKYSDLTSMFTEEVKQVIENIHTVVDQNEIGSFSFGPLLININKKNNIINEYKTNKNIELLLTNEIFEFV
jgi:GT2 family glycosyltransferase